MHKTVVALYDNIDDAQQSVRDLVDSGIHRDQISLVANDRTGQFGETLRPAGETSGAAQGAGVGAGIGAALGGIGGLLVGLGALTIPGIGPVLAAGPLAAAMGGVAGAGAGAIAGGAAGGLVGGLADMGVTEQQAQYFAEGIRRGGTLLTVRTDDQTTPTAKDVMNRHHPIDVNERASQWRQAGWSRFDPASGPFTPPTGAAGPGPMGQSEPMVGAPGMGDMGEQHTAMGEAEIGNTGMGAASMPEPAAVTRSFDEFETEFRNDYANSFSDSGYTYDEYMPAYRYGYDLATNQRYTGANWGQIEPDARQYWEERHPGTWDQFKDSIQHAWERVSSSIS